MLDIFYIMKNLIKIISYNFFIFFLLIFIFEILFGYYFKKNNFGYIMRSERQKNQIYEVIHNDKKYRYNYIRNFYGFRGKEIIPSNIKIIFEGGSTGNQKFTPEELTIVGLLNLKLKNLNKNIEITNASTDGKTTRGYVNDFIYWFPKLENFNPEYVIFYTGINDSNKSQSKTYDIPWRENFSSRVRDYLKNNSKLVELLKKLQFKYFNNEVRIEYSVIRTGDNLYNNYKYINYHDALVIHKNNENIKLLKQFQKRLSLLKNQIDKLKFIPIFITQINFDGLSNPNLFLINETLKIFCKENNYPIIKLDEIILDLEANSFYDTMHTTPEGNKVIANKIYPKLIKILN